MLGFLARLVGCFVLAAGFAIAVADIARSLSAEALRLTTIGEVAELLARTQTGAGSTDAADASTPLLLERLGALGEAALVWPAAPSLAVLALVLLLIGRRRSVSEFAR